MTTKLKLTKYLLLPILFLVFFEQGRAQDSSVNSLITEMAPDCDDIIYNLSKLIPDYYNTDKKDSAIVLSEYWIDNCGNGSKMFLLINLIKMSQNKSYILPSDYNDILKNRFYRNYSTRVYDYDNYQSKFTERVINFSKFQYNLLDSLANNHPLPEYDKLILKALANDKEPLLNKLKNKELINTPLQVKYDSIQEGLRNANQFHMAVTSGIWIPQGNAALLGNHPYFGFKIGGKSKRILYDMVLAFRFLKSANNYNVIQDGILTSTDEFFGGYIGLDMGYAFVNKPESEIDIIGGIAYDGFDAITGDENNDEDNVSINTLNLNLGLAYRFYYNDNGYLGLETKYAFLNYKNKGGTDFGGNSVTIGINWGFSGSIDSPYYNW